jgi:hypothetical protein
MVMRLPSVALLVLAGACDRRAQVSSAPAAKTELAAAASEPDAGSAPDEVRNPFDLQLKQRGFVICEHMPVPADSLAAHCLSEDVAREFIGSLQRALRTKDRWAFADTINYPIVFRVDGSPLELIVGDAEEFARNYDHIVTPTVAAAIRNANGQKLSINREGVTIGGDEHHFVNYQGVALGRGTVWFDWICARSVEDGCKGKFLVRTIDARRSR